MGSPGVFGAGRPCTICEHVDRAAIEAQILAKKPLRDIAGRFGLSKSSVARHRDNDMAQVVALVQEAFKERDAIAEVRHARGVAATLETMANGLDDSLRIARQIRDESISSDPKVALASMGEETRIVGTKAKLLTTVGQASGEIPMASTQVNVLVQSDAFKEAQQHVKDDVARFFAWVGEWAPDDKAEWVRRAIAALQAGTLDEWERDVRAVTVKGGGE